MRASPRYGFSRGEWEYYEPGKPTQGGETFACGHCNKQTFIKPMCDPAEIGGLCKGCMRLVCGPCVDQMRCDPIEKKLERQEARGSALRSYGI